MSNTFQNGHALLIGAGADLPNTAADAAGLAAFFKDPGRCAYPAAQVTLLTAEQATRSAILAALDDLVQVGDDATVVIYFSGHGYEVATSIGKATYLMPFGYDPQQLYQTAVSGAELAAKLAAIPAQKLLLLLDCCHAGGLDPARTSGIELTKTPLPPEATGLFARGSGRALIASSQANELSYAGTPYSAFTLALLEALAGKGAAQQDGYVRLTDLALHTRQLVPQRTGGKQHPIFNFQQADNFIVAYYAGGDTQPKALPFGAEVAIEPEPGAFRRQGGDTYSATVHGDGAIAQGTGNTVVGRGGVAIGGNVGGAITTGDSRTARDDTAD